MQSMSVQQLLQSPKSIGTKGEVATEKQSMIEGLLVNGNTEVGEANSKNSLASESAEGSGALDFSTLFAGLKAGEEKLIGKVEKQKTETSVKNPKLVEANIVATNSNLEQLLNNLKGTSGANGLEADQEVSPDHAVKKDFFPGKKVESENPLEFLIKGSKEKNISAMESNAEIPVEQELGELPSKNSFFPNKITNPNMAPKAENPELAVKLMSGEDFVKNQNAVGVNTKNILEAIQGKKQNPQMKNYGKGQNILNDNLIKNTNDLAFKETKKLKSEAIDELKTPEMKVSHDLSMIKEQAIPTLQLRNSSSQENKVSVETKVLDLSNIDAKNTNEIIKTISDYVEQNQVANKTSLDLTVKHESLGQFKIQVNKAPNQNQVDMQITTSSQEGHKFFVAHEADLMRNLSQAGVNLSDLRIISSMKESTPFSQSESKQFSSFQHEQNGESKQFMSFESGDFREGAQKRKSLWDEYQERYGA